MNKILDLSTDDKRRDILDIANQLHDNPTQTGASVYFYIDDGEECSDTGVFINGLKEYFRDNLGICE